MSDIDIVVLPLMYVCAVVTGAALSMCGRRKYVDELEQQIDSLQWELAATNKHLENAIESLRKIGDRMSENDKEDELDSQVLSESDVGQSIDPQQSDK